MGITEILGRIWLFNANKIKISKSVSKQPTQLIIAAHNCHIGHIIVTIVGCLIEVSSEGLLAVLFNIISGWAQVEGDVVGVTVDPAAAACAALLSNDIFIRKWNWRCEFEPTAQLAQALAAAHCAA